MAHELPELPDAHGQAIVMRADYEDEYISEQDAYTADQMRAYATAHAASLEAEVARLRAALTDLVAMVRGECPSILDEDSGGSAHLSMRIDDALSAPRG